MFGYFYHDINDEIYHIQTNVHGSDLSLVISVYEELNLIYKSWKRLNPSVKTIERTLDLILNSGYSIISPK